MSKSATSDTVQVIQDGVKALLMDPTCLSAVCFLGRDPSALAAFRESLFETLQKVATSQPQGSVSLLRAAVSANAPKVKSLALETMNADLNTLFQDDVLRHLDEEALCKVLQHPAARRAPLEQVLTAIRKWLIFVYGPNLSAHETHERAAPLMKCVAVGGVSEDDLAILDKSGLLSSSTMMAIVDHILGNASSDSLAMSPEFRGKSIFVRVSLPDGGSKLRWFRLTGCLRDVQTELEQDADVEVPGNKKLVLLHQDSRLPDSAPLDTLVAPGAEFQMAMLELCPSLTLLARDLDQLTKWGGSAWRGKSLQLRYRSSRDGDKPADFHRLCDNLPGTVTIIKTTNGSIFGGYTNAAWRASPQLECAGVAGPDDAWLFSLVRPSGGPPIKLPIRPEPTCLRCAIICGEEVGPSFGYQGAILLRGSFSDPSPPTSSNLGHTYDTRGLPNPADSKGFFCGQVEGWSVAEAEVFQIV